MTAYFAAAACAETYASVEPMLQRIVSRFHALHGCPREELEAEARLAFQRAYTSYDRSRARFTTWCWWKVWCGLLDHKKKISRRARRATVVSLDQTAEDGRSSLAGAIPAARPEFDRGGLERQLTDDARVLLRLVLQAPAEIREAVVGGVSDPRAARAALRGLLRDMGWASAEVAAAFAEIRAALGWRRPSAEKLFDEILEEA